VIKTLPGALAVTAIIVIADRFEGVFRRVRQDQSAVKKLATISPAFLFRACIPWRHRDAVLIETASA